MAAQRTAALVALLLAGAARGDDPTARGFDPDPVRPAFSIRGDFAVEDANTADPGDWVATAGLQWVQGLLALKLGDESDQLLASRLQLNLGATRSFAVPLLGRAEVGLQLPVALLQRSDFSLLTRQGVSGPLVDPISSFALGDLRLGAKATLLPASATPLGIAVAAVADLRLPTGNKDAFAGDGPAFLPSAVASRAFGKLRLDLQAGYHVRGEGQYAQLVVHDGWTGGLGASLVLPPLRQVQRWIAIAELTGAWPRGVTGAGARYRAALSGRLGVRAEVHPMADVEFGAGTGLGEAGYGRESFRVFAALRLKAPPPGWTPPPKPVPPPEMGPPPPATAEPEAAPLEGSDDDGDGVLVPLDLCPDQPGTLETDGCPDRDKDGIPDPQDRCPDEPGPAVSDGCPPAEDEPLVEIETQRLTLRDAIQFDFGKDTIKPESDRILNQIATLLSQNPEVKRIRVEGHTDSVGSEAYNLDLSQRRAASVVSALVARGVKRGVLYPQGYGESRPVADNGTALGRAKNRRVEFVVVDESEGEPKP